MRAAFSIEQTQARTHTLTANIFTPFVRVALNVSIPQAYTRTQKQTAITTVTTRYKIKPQVNS